VGQGVHLGDVGRVFSRRQGVLWVLRGYLGDFFVRNGSGWAERLTSVSPSREVLGHHQVVDAPRVIRR